MANVFISYRRHDSQYQADKLHKLFKENFSTTDSKVFIDVDNIPFGEDFEDHITATLESCDVMLVLIGTNWLNAAKGGGSRRLDDPLDWVRMEIATGLSMNIKVVPVLLDGTRMPSEESLPDELKPIVRRQAIDVRRLSFDADAERLLRGLGIRPKRPSPTLKLKESIATAPASTLSHAISILLASIALPSMFGTSFQSVVQWSALFALVVSTYQQVVDVIFSYVPVSVSGTGKHICMFVLLAFVAVSVESIQRQRKFFPAVLLEAFWNPAMAVSNDDGLFSINKALPALMYVIMSAPVFLLLSAVSLVGAAYLIDSTLGAAVFIALIAALTWVLFFIIGAFQLPAATTLGIATALAVYSFFGARWIDRDGNISRMHNSEARPKTRNNKKVSRLKTVFWDVFFLPARVVLVLPLLISVALANSIRTLLLIAACLSILIVVNSLMVWAAAQ